MRRIRPKWRDFKLQVSSDRKLADIAGKPEIHWDDASDLAHDSRYIRPDRLENLWASYGEGVATAMMKQVFTVTKGNRRHTFLETVLRATLLTTPASPLAATEIDDLVRRSFSTNMTLQQFPLLSAVSRFIGLAQAQNKSFTAGLIVGDGVTAGQASWEYLTFENNKLPVYSTLRFSRTDITLISSETLPASRVPAPFHNQTCAAKFMNLAYGGTVFCPT